MYKYNEIHLLFEQSQGSIAVLLVSAGSSSEAVGVYPLGCVCAVLNGGGGSFIALQEKQDRVQNHAHIVNDSVCAHDHKRPHNNRGMEIPMP